MLDPKPGCKAQSTKKRRERQALYLLSRFPNEYIGADRGMEKKMNGVYCINIDLGPVVAEKRIFPIACPNIMV